MFEQQREVQRAQRAAMEEMVTEQRQELLARGADEFLLREFELNAVDLAVVSLLARNMDTRMRELFGES